MVEMTSAVVCSRISQGSFVVERPVYGSSSITIDCGCKTSAKDSL